MHFYRRTQVNFFCDRRRGVRKEKRPFPSWSTFATIVSRIPVCNSELKPRVVCVGCERFFTIPLIRQVWRDLFISHRFSRPTSSLWSFKDVFEHFFVFCRRGCVKWKRGKTLSLGLRETDSVLYASLFLRGERVVGTTRCVHSILCSDQ